MRTTSGYVRWRVGDTLAAYATNTATLLERARVLSVEEKPGSNPDHAPHVTLTLDRAVPQLAEGDQVWAIEAGNHLIVLVLMGAILGAWR